MATGRMSFYRGDSPLIVFNLTVSGTAADLTGYEAFFTLTNIQDPVTDSGAAIQKNLTPIPNPTTGVVSFQLLNADTQNLIPDDPYYWDLQLKDSSGYIITPISGTATIEIDYTRRTS